VKQFLKGLPREAKVTLKAGKVELYCTVPGHKAAVRSISFKLKIELTS